MQSSPLPSWRTNFNNRSNIITDMVFQQDNDSKHKSAQVTKWLDESGFTVMKWPPQSPDLSPIEHLWYYLKNRLDKSEIPPSSQHEL